MMGDALYMTYPELEAELDGTSLRLRTPWMRMKATIAEYAVSGVEECLADMRAGRWSLGVSTFLEAFADYAVAYELPEGVEIATIGARDVESIWDLSRRGEGAFDAVTAFTWLRRQLLNDAAERASHLETNARSLRTMVRQSLFITERCDAVLQRAVTAFPEVGDELARYRSEERGHDALLRRAVDEMGAANEPVLEPTRDLMETLESAAGTSLLAFAIGLEAMEGLELDESESALAKVVRAAFGDRAAMPLQQHYVLNRALKHGSVGLGLVRAVRIVDECRVSEAAAVVTKIGRHKAELVARLAPVP